MCVVVDICGYLHIMANKHLWRCSGELKYEDDDGVQEEYS